jgi:uncharacterized protein
MKIFDQLYIKIVADLESKLPDWLTYHDVNHTKRVLEKAILIGEYEKITKNELRLLKIAALYHDVGYTTDPKNHETEGCKFAKVDLLKLGFSKLEIEQICGIIMATKLPQSPNSHVEGILADADLEYLGTDEFDLISEKLYTEIRHSRPDLTVNDWYLLQIDFITKHTYHTDYCRKNREEKKQKNLQKIKEKVLSLD